MHSINSGMIEIMSMKISCKDRVSNEQFYAERKRRSYFRGNITGTKQKLIYVWTCDKMTATLGEK